MRALALLAFLLLPLLPTPAPAVAAGLSPTADAPRLLRVGPGQPLARPSEAARIAQDGDIVEIEAGTYHGDVASWPQSALTIRGVGGRPRIDAAGRGAEAKAVWVIKGHGVRIEDVELTGCRVPDRNGAGIRAEGGDLALRGVLIHGNEMGVQTARDFTGELLIEDSEIARNTVDHERHGALGHNIYVHGADRFILRGSWVHGAVTGHNVKSRARENRILYNLIEDGALGRASYLVDIPEGTPTLILGNLLRQGSLPANDALVSFAAELGRDATGVPLHLVSNTAVSESGAAILLRNHGRSPAMLVNNALVGVIRPLEGAGVERGGLTAPLADFLAPDRLDWRPRPGSVLVDRALAPPIAFGREAVPDRQYLHPHRTEPRRVRGARADVGAFEAGG